MLWSKFQDKKNTKIFAAQHALISFISKDLALIIFCFTTFQKKILPVGFFSWQPSAMKSLPSENLPRYKSSRCVSKAIIEHIPTKLRKAFFKSPRNLLFFLCPQKKSTTDDDLKRQMFFRLRVYDPVIFIICLSFCYYEPFWKKKDLFASFFSLSSQFKWKRNDIYFNNISYWQKYYMCGCECE